MINLAVRATRAMIRRSLPLVLRPSSAKELVRLGSRYGGWRVPLRQLNEDSVCYSFGVGEDISFDIALAKLTGSTVHLFDPTPRSKAHFDLLTRAAGGDATAKSHLAQIYPRISAEAVTLLRYHEYGIWSANEELEFFKPRDPTHVSHSLTNIQKTGVGFTATVKTARTIASTLGHDRIDLLKMDIEGAEFAVLDDLLANGPLPRILCVEFDAAAHGGLRELRQLHTTINKLAKQGLRLSHIEDWNFLFLAA